MTDKEMSKAAVQFAKDWADASYERGQAQPFWIALLRTVFGVEYPEKYISFEEKVKYTKTHYADGFIDVSRVLIEQKSGDVDLEKPYMHGGAYVTPFQQAKNYDNELRWSKHARWIITCNFHQFFIYDMDKQGFPHEVIELKNLGKDYRKLSILTKEFDKTNEIAERKEKLIASKASEFVRNMYQELKQHNKMNSTLSHSLNVFCVRVVFCLYADDSHLFDNRQFHKFLNAYSADQLQEKFGQLFMALNIKKGMRPQLTDKVIDNFPYVNGGLFAPDKDFVTPVIPKSVRDMLLIEADNIGKQGSDEKFTWDKISPTNFGCIFESTVDSDVRESGGMHYTTSENIHHVIRPLFLNHYEEKLDDILEMPVNNKAEIKAQDDALEAFRNEISSLRFLDPACGSGNFLTETFKQLRRMELKALRQMKFIEKERYMGNSDPCKVQIKQFYGIEIDDFAANVARTALWISECQMLKEVKEITEEELTGLPLVTNDNIKPCDALTTDWNKILPRDRKHQIYIIGNPPFQGSQRKKEEQKKSKDIAMSLEYKGEKIWDKHGKLDFACAWYAKTADYMRGYNNIEAAFVTTSSITQGEQVAILWEPLIKHFNLCISFAWKSFKWFNKADNMAQVHCVIIGLAKSAIFEKQKKMIYSVDDECTIADNINPYLINAENFFIKSRPKPLGNVPEMVKGSIPVDGGNLIIEEEDYNDFITKEPDSKKYIKPLMGAKEFLHNKKRYCLWIPDDIPSSELKSMPMVLQRIKAVEKMRNNSSKAATKEFAKRAYRFMEIRQPNSEYILVPSHSSENRDYIPIGFMSPEIICSNANLMIPEPNKWLFGILESSIHMIWTKYTCGRIKSDYRYSEDVVYNNFPWKELTEAEKAKIETTANAILAAREKDKDSSLADMYDVGPIGELLMAHEANDKVVADIFGIDLKKSEEEIVLELMQRSVKLCQIADRPKRKNKRKKRISRR